jgi:hypothetical protein
MPLLGSLFYRTATATTATVATREPPTRSAEEAAAPDDTAEATMTRKRKSSSSSGGGNRNSIGRVSPVEAASQAANAIEAEGLREENRRQKAAIGRLAKEFACPISTVLPIDPVIAEVRVFTISSLLF